MSVTLREIADLVQGQLTGDGQTQIHGAAIIRDAQAGEITFAEGSKHGEQLNNSPAAAVIVSDDLRPEGMPFITVANVQESFAHVVRHFRPQRDTARKHDDEQVPRITQEPENAAVHRTYGPRRRSLLMRPDAFQSMT